MLRKLINDGHTGGMFASECPCYNVGFFPVWSAMEDAVKELDPELIIVDDIQLSAYAIPHKDRTVIGASTQLAGLAEFFPDFAEILKNNGIRIPKLSAYLSALSASKALYRKTEDPEKVSHGDFRQRLIQVELKDGVYETFSYTAKEAADRLEILGDRPCCVMEVDGGIVNYSIMALFDGEKFLNPVHVQIEDFCDEAQTGFLSRTASTSDRLFKITLGKIARWLKTTSFVGPLEFDFVVTKDGEVLVTDVEPGFQNIPMAAWVYGLDTDLADLLRRLPSKTGVSYPYHNGFTAAVTAQLPAYDSWNLPWLTREGQKYVRKALAIPSLGFRVSPLDTDGDSEMYWAQVAKDSDHDIRTCGPLIGVAVARGETAVEAGSAARAVASRIKVPGARPGNLPLPLIEPLVDAKLIARK